MMTEISSSGPTQLDANRETAIYNKLVEAYLKANREPLSDEILHEEMLSLISSFGNLVEEAGGNMTVVRTRRRQQGTVGNITKTDANGDDWYVSSRRNISQIDDTWVPGLSSFALRRTSNLATETAHMLLYPGREHTLRTVRHRYSFEGINLEDGGIRWNFSDPVPPEYYHVPPNYYYEDKKIVLANTQNMIVRARSALGK